MIRNSKQFSETRHRSSCARPGADVTTHKAAREERQSGSHPATGQTPRLDLWGVGREWWQWLLSIPASTNPILDARRGRLGQGQSGSVWFLAGSFGGPATRTCDVPTGKALFFPILNTVFGAGVLDCEPSVPGVVCDVNAFARTQRAQMDNPLLLEASIDGVPLQNLSAYRARSPVFRVPFPSTVSSPAVRSRLTWPMDIG